MAHPARTSQVHKQCPWGPAAASAVGSVIVAGGPGKDVQARACLRGESRTELLPRACCQLLLSLCLPEGVGVAGRQWTPQPSLLALAP